MLFIVKGVLKYIIDNAILKHKYMYLILIKHWIVIGQLNLNNVHM